ncbi:MAG: hypothetical protein L0154_14515 [Chloroflexi bacterium]|nr:hypothetical protein [Chloroflexota bacterium]
MNRKRLRTVIGTTKPPPTLAALRQRGRDYVRRHFDWSVIVSELLNVYETLV